MADLEKAGQHGQPHNDRVDVYFHGASEAEFSEFKEQVYHKLDWMIGQNEQILARLGAGGDGDDSSEKQARLDAAVASLKEKRLAAQAAMDNETQGR